ncbi:response regulator [Desulfococcaceae bacterium HSG9]|nr:response regulator [Desulfococcaceae bacterium HSG9]
MNVLVVEYNPLYALQIVQTIQAWGHHAESCATGHEALAEIKTKQFDFLLTDVFLPDMSAHYLIPQVNSFDSAIGICTMIEDNSIEIEDEIRKLGIRYYMARSFQNEELEAILWHFCFFSKNGANNGGVKLKDSFDFSQNERNLYHALQ